MALTPNPHSSDPQKTPGERAIEAPPVCSECGAAIPDDRPARGPRRTVTCSPECGRARGLRKQREWSRRRNRTPEFRDKRRRSTPAAGDRGES